MREIKFRAWDKKLEAMHDDLAISEGWLNKFFREMPGYADKENYILMQFTGLKDRDGVEIYESDVLAVWEITIEDVNYLSKDNVSRHEVKWCGAEQYPAFDLDRWDNIELNGLAEIMQSGDWECKVIGDIYRNPELLDPKVATQSNA